MQIGCFCLMMHLKIEEEIKLRKALLSIVLSELIIYFLFYQ